MHKCNHRKGKEVLWDTSPTQSHRPTIPQVNPWDNWGQFRDGTNTDLEANTAQSLLGEESFTSGAGLTCSNKTTLWEGWCHSPAILPAPVIASTGAWCLPSVGKHEVSWSPRQQDCPRPGSGREDSRSCQLQEAHLHLAWKQPGRTSDGSLTLQTFSLL